MRMFRTLALSAFLAIQLLACSSETLADPTEPSTKLLLQQGKVAVSVMWRNPYQPGSPPAAAFAVPEGDQFGYFYFSDATNLEIFVKVLDWGADRPYLLFWASLTDFGYTITFTNTVTGKKVDFVKPPSTLDGGSSDGALAHKVARGAMWSRDGASITPVEEGESLSLVEAKPRALASADELLLQNGAVAVSVTYRNQYSGQTGVAIPIAKQEQFGYFYFSGADNPEVFIKVLDWGADRPYILFWAGLTTFEFTASFRNVATGVVVKKTKVAGVVSGGADQTCLPHNEPSSCAAPVVSSFAATPAVIPPGSSTTLSWKCVGATTATIDNGIGSVAMSGSRTISPSATTTYTLTLTGPGGTASAAAKVTVSAAIPPGIVTEPLMWTTLAGAPTGNEDGPATQARFSLDGSSLAVDAAGNVYVADTGNNTIRKVAPDGSVTTLAGSGEAGFQDGPGSVARFSFPIGVAADAEGYVYVADQGNNRIRKVDPDGFVSTLVGDWQSGYVDGPAATARINRPMAVAVDRAGNVFFVDAGNQRIRKVTPDGTVSTVAGNGTAGFADGPAAAAQFNNPTGVAVDAAGNVYVADGDNARIRKVSAAGMVTTLAGSGAPGFADGPAPTARFSSVTALAVDSQGNVYVADLWNNRIRKVTPDGTVITFAGSGLSGYLDGPASSARFAGPSGIALDTSGSVYVTEQGNNRIRRISPEGAVSTFAGSGPTSSWGYADGTGTAARFAGPSGVAVDPAGNTYLAENGNHVIRKVTLAGTVTTFAGSGQAGYLDGAGTAARFSNPTGVALSTPGDLYVADQRNHRIRKVAADGKVTTFAGSGTAGYRDGASSSAQFSSPTGLALDSAGNILVADRDNHRIRKVAPDGTVTTVAGAGTSGFADGAASAALFNQPAGVAVDGTGAIWVADSGNNRVRKITGGIVSTVAGSQYGGFADGPGSTAQFSGPSGVGLDASGNVYIADSWNHRIRKMAPDGTVSTVGGNGASGGNDGVGTSARFRNPQAVVVGLDGVLVVADSGNNAIRVGRAAALSEAATIDAVTSIIGQVRQLGASGTGATAWSWQVVRRPAGSTALLSSTGVRGPTFLPDAVGLYVFRLTATVTGGMQSVTEASLDVSPVPPTVPPQDHVLHFLGKHVAISPSTAALSLGSEFTMEAWIYLTSPTNGATIIIKPDDGNTELWNNSLSTGLALSNDGKTVSMFQSSGQKGNGTVAVGGTPIPLRTWTHVAGTLSKGQLSLYLNGRLEVRSASRGPVPPGTAPFHVGGTRMPDGGVVNGFVGAIRQVRVWDRALSSEELRSVAARTLTGTEPGLLACWPLDDGVGRTARDISQQAVALSFPQNPPSGYFDQPAWWLVGKGGPFFVIEPIPWPRTISDLYVPYPPPIFDFYPIDYDSDGRVDLVAYGSEFFNSIPTRLFALHNNGRGGLDDATQTVLGEASMIGTRDAKVADFDGDGRADLLLGDQGIDTVPAPGAQSKLLLQTPDGRLSDQTATRLPVINTFTHHVLVADVNSDGYPDALMCNVCCGRLGTELYMNHGSGPFSVDAGRLPNFPSPNGPWSARTAACFADVRRIGRMDLLLGSNDTPERLLYNDGTGHFSLAPDGAIPPTYGGGEWSAMDIVSADFNGDGWPDFLLSLTAAYKATFLQLLLNNGDGTFHDASDRIPQNWPAPAPYANSWISWLSPVDINGDGWMDFLATGEAGVRLYLNDHGEKFVDASAAVPMGLAATGRPMNLSGGPNPDIVFMGSTGYSYYIARSIKPLPVDSVARPEITSGQSKPPVQ